MDLKIRAVFFCVLIHAVKRICQESIADSVGVPKKTISNIVNKGQKSKIAEMAQNFKPLLYK